MAHQLTHRPPPPHHAARRLLLLLLALVALAGLAALLAPGLAQSATCMSGVPTLRGADWPEGDSWPGRFTPARTRSNGDELDCGGDQPPPPPPPPPPPGDGGGTSSCSGAVILYEHANYQGRCWSFPAGDTSWVGDSANDQTSSIRVADGYVATIFEHSFSGGSYNTGTSPDPWSWTSVGNDSVSSLVVQPSEPDWSYYWGDNETEAPRAENLNEVAKIGCAKVGISVTRRSPWRRQWVYALFTRFCWNGSRVTALWEREIAVTIDSIAFPFSLIQGWRHTPLGFQQGEADYPSTVLRADGRFEFCGFKYGCITSAEPWVRVELRGNGEALCSTSARTTPVTCPRASS